MPELLTPDRLETGIKTSTVYRVYVPQIDSYGHEAQFQFVSAITDVGEITAGDFKNILAKRASGIKNEKAKVFVQLGESFGGYLQATEAQKVMKRDAGANGQKVLFLTQSAEDKLSACRAIAEHTAQLVGKELGLRDARVAAVEHTAEIFEEQCHLLERQLTGVGETLQAERDRIERLQGINRAAEARLGQEQNAHAKDIAKLDRRRFFWQIGALVSATTTVAVAGKVWHLLKLLETQPNCPQQPEPVAVPASPAPPQTEREKPAELVEKFLKISPFELVLWDSLPTFLEDTKTYRDNILDQFAVSKYFFGNKFLYRGNKEDVYQNREQKIYRFTLIGEKSGYVGHKKEHRKMWLNTTLADVVNSILNLPEISQEELKAWIKWMYKRAFGVSLDESYIRFEWEKDGELASIFYDAPAGTSTAPDSVLVEVMREMDGLKAMQPGGNLSKMREPQQIVDSKKHLLLPSGISPKHDVLVPASLMKPDPTFTLSLNGFGTWEERKASMLNDRIGRFEEARKSKKTSTAKAFGREFDFDLMAPLVERNDPLIKMLAEFLVKKIPADNHAQRIGALVEFVQSLPYKRENDTDVDRPGFLTLFNGGGDCNNLTILFAQLMMGLGYETAILQTEAKKEDGMIHAMGGVPAKYFPDQQNWKGGGSTKEWVAVELTNKWQIGERKLGEKNGEVVFYIEEL